MPLIHSPLGPTLAGGPQPASCHATATTACSINQTWMRAAGRAVACGPRRVRPLHVARSSHTDAAQPEQLQQLQQLQLLDDTHSSSSSVGSGSPGAGLAMHHPHTAPVECKPLEVPPHTEELDILMMPPSPRACVTVLLQPDMGSSCSSTTGFLSDSNSNSDEDWAAQPLLAASTAELQLQPETPAAAATSNHSPDSSNRVGSSLHQPGAEQAQPADAATPGTSQASLQAEVVSTTLSIRTMSPLTASSTHASSQSIAAAAADAAAASSSSGSSSSSSSSSSTDADTHVCSPGKLWALGLLAASYVHQASTSFSIPVMLPMVSTSLHLNDLQGAMLTTGYSYLYAFALVPMGMLVDKVPKRPVVLGTAVALWSGLTILASHASSFSELMAARVGLAAAHSAQNVVCFGMIPELFPTTRSTAMAFYNCAIYLGRGLMYMVTNNSREVLSHQPAAIDAASQALIQYDAYGNILVPLEKLDLRFAQLVYTIGDMAAIRAPTPLYEVAAAAGGLQDMAWRQVLEQLSIPGLLISAALLLTVRESRGLKPAPLHSAPTTLTTTTISTDASTHVPSASSASSIAALTMQAAATSSAAAGVQPSSSGTTSSQDRSNARAGGGLGSWWAQLWGKQQDAPAAPVASSSSSSAGGTSSTGSTNGSNGGGVSVWSLASNKPFLTITAAAALNDFGSYAFIGWQSTFYERIYHLDVTQYAPMLATILPVAGIIGGVGGGLLADRLSKVGQRHWVTVATSLLAAPLIWASLTADTPEHSFMFLGLGFALSEGWRAPAAVMCRSVVPSEVQSTAISLYLCLRNLLGGLGPLMIAHVATGLDLQLALQLLPPVYFASGLLFWSAESQIAANASLAAAAAAMPLPSSASPAPNATGASNSNGQRSSTASGSSQRSNGPGASTAGMADILARSIGFDAPVTHAVAAAATAAAPDAQGQPVPVPVPVTEQPASQVPTRV